MQIPPEYKDGAPNNNVKFRWIGLAFSGISLILTMVALFAISFGTGANNFTLFGVGMAPDATIILAFSIITLVLGIVSLFVPVLSVVTGLVLIGTALMVNSNTEYALNTESLVLYIVIAIAIMIIGIMASKFIGQYIGANVRNVTMFKGNLMAWLGIRLPGNETNTP